MNDTICFLFVRKAVGYFDSLACNWVCISFEEAGEYLTFKENVNDKHRLRTKVI